MGQRRRFSFRDAVVITAIGCIAFLLLGSFLLRTNVEANRTRSQNNLRHISIAIQNYHDGNNQRFPLLCDHGLNSMTRQGYAGLFFVILPQVECGDVYNRFQLENPASYYEGPNAPSRVDYHHVYVSPNDPHSDDTKLASMEVVNSGTRAPFLERFSGQYATSSYVANGSLFRPGTGVRDVTDGISHTIMLTERYRACQRSENPDDVVYNCWALGAYSASTPSFATPLPDDKEYPTAHPLMEQFVPPTSVRETGDITGRTGNKEINYSAIAKSANAPSGFQVVPQSGCDPRIPQALQTAGLLVVKADCSTSTFPAHMSSNVFWAIVTPAGNEDFPYMTCD
ncbi:MAG: DUF1559 domain-containing protein [Gemmataceae bacterium]